MQSDVQGGPRSRVCRVRQLHVAQQTLVSGSRKLAWSSKDSKSLHEWCGALGTRGSGAWCAGVDGVCSTDADGMCD